MSNRIVGPSGQPLDSDGKQRTPKMEERVIAALEYWKNNQKDMAFATALNAIAYQSNGLAGLAKLIRSLEDKVAKLSKEVEELKNPPA